MGRLTISLDDEMHQALKETAARQRRSIAAIIEESLRFRGIRTRTDARNLVARARQRSGLGDEEALALAVEETRAARGR
jgi:predicted transcriptional regulator